MSLSRILGMQRAPLEKRALPNVERLMANVADDMGARLEYDRRSLNGPFDFAVNPWPSEMP